MTRPDDRRPVAFVLDMSANGLGVVRSLGRERIPVVGVDYKRDAPGLKSRFCRALVTPRPNDDPQAVLGLLARKASEGSQKAILYPTSDEYVLFVSRFRRELSQHFLYAMPPENVLESLMNKRKQYEIAQQTGMPYPKTYYLSKRAEVEHVKDDLEYPVFIKPCYSHVWRERYRSKGFRVTGPSELAAKCEMIFDAKLEAIVQSIVAGPDGNVVEVYSYLSDKHEPLATLVSRKLRQYPNNFGVSTCSETVHDKEALRIALKFYRDVGYQGLGHIELKKDDRDGRYKLIELNARSPLSSILATRAGVNFPLIQYLDLTGGPIERDHDYEDGVRWLDAVPDLLAFRGLCQNQRFALLRWLESVWTADCHAYFAYDDLVPFAKEYQNKLGRLPEYTTRHRA